MTPSQISLFCEFTACALAATTSGALFLFQKYRRTSFRVGAALSFGAMLAAVIIVGTFLVVSWQCGALFFSSILTDPRLAKTACPSTDFLAPVFNAASIIAALGLGVSFYMAAKVIEPKAVRGEPYPPRHWTTAAFGLGFGVVFFMLKFLP